MKSKAMKFKLLHRSLLYLSHVKSWLPAEVLRSEEGVASGMKRGAWARGLRAGSAKSLLSVLGVCLLAQACVPSFPSMNDAGPKPLTIPKAFPAGLPKESGDKAKGAAKTDDWKAFFTDPHLQSLVAEALKRNQELHILDQEIQIAQNEVMARKGEYLPKLGAKAGYDLEKTSRYTSKGASDELTNLPDPMKNRSIGLTASWEVDIWKKLRNAAKSSYYHYLATVEGRKFATTKLVAEVAGSYYELVALENQLRIIARYVDTLAQATEVVKLQQQAGRTTSLAVKRFESELLKNQSRQQLLKQQLAVTENELNRLLGRLPEPIKRSNKNLMDIQPHPLKMGVPTALLDNRPDIRQAALELKSAKLNVASARARFYPSLSIEAGAGFAAFNASHLFSSPEASFYNLGAGLSAPLLNRQAIKADYFSANNKQIQALYDYEKTFIGAYTEVANQLATIKTTEKMVTLKSNQAQMLEEAVDISNTLFKAARIDYLESLLTQRDYLDAKLELVETKKTQLLAYIYLFKALGGGWKQADAAP
jgi:NodT family efflux transporter outer membrane factor (OMF) lipoprotein